MYLHETEPSSAVAVPNTWAEPGGVGHLDGIVPSKVKGLALPESGWRGKAGPTAGQAVKEHYKNIDEYQVGDLAGASTAGLRLRAGEKTKPLTGCLPHDFGFLAAPRCRVVVLEFDRGGPRRYL